MSQAALHWSNCKIKQYVGVIKNKYVYPTGATLFDIHKSTDTVRDISLCQKTDYFARLLMSNVYFVMLWNEKQTNNVTINDTWWW